MRYDILLFLIVFVPVIGSFILPLIGKVSRQLRNILALAFVAVSVILSFVLLPAVLSGNNVTINYPLIPGLSFILHADMLAVFMSIVASFIGAIIVLYSFGYISHYENQDEYYMMVVLFLVR